MTSEHNGSNGSLDDLLNRHFAGNGHFTITATELTLQDIWLGTRQAPNKPHICELTFAREAEAPRDESR